VKRLFLGFHTDDLYPTDNWLIPKEKDHASYHSTEYKETV
jgi:hypothetical protein